jgi:hypothetical protein
VLCGQREHRMLYRLWGRRREAALTWTNSFQSFFRICRTLRPIVQIINWNLPPRQAFGFLNLPSVLLCQVLPIKHDLNKSFVPFWPVNLSAHLDLVHTPHLQLKYWLKCEPASVFGQHFNFERLTRLLNL